MTGVQCCGCGREGFNLKLILHWNKATCSAHTMMQLEGAPELEKRLGVDFGYRLGWEIIFNVNVSLGHHLLEVTDLEDKRGKTDNRWKSVK